jgi:hypothetical protein
MSEQAFTLDERIAAIREEVGRREYVLRDRVRLRRMSSWAAEREIALMKAAHAALVFLRGQIEHDERLRAEWAALVGEDAV